MLQGSKAIKEGEIGTNIISQVRNRQVGLRMSRRLGGNCRTISRGEGAGVSCLDGLNANSHLRDATVCSQSGHCGI